MTREHTRIIEAVRAGCSIDEAATQAGKPVATVRRWLTEGRKRPDAQHGEFARTVDAAREAQRVELDNGPMTHDEIERRLTHAIRQGSLQAVKIWLELHPQDRAPGAVDPFAEFEAAAPLRAVS
jgi:hypothetical protein